MASTAMFDGFIEDDGRQRARSGSVSTTNTTGTTLTISNGLNGSGTGTPTSSLSPTARTTPTIGVSLSGYFVDEDPARSTSSSVATTPTSVSPGSLSASSSRSNYNGTADMPSRNSLLGPRDQPLRTRPSRSELNTLQPMPEEMEDGRAQRAAGSRSQSRTPRPREDEERTLSASRGTRSRSGSVMTANGSVSTTPTQSHMDKLAAHRQQSLSQEHPVPQRPRQGSSARMPPSMIPPGARYRNTPRLPHHQAEPAPSTAMYWSRAPVFGHLPDRPLRGHSATLIDNIVWQIGGCDQAGTCFKDIYTFNTDTMQWAHPEITGEGPPACRAHSATAVDRRIFVFGGGAALTFFNDVYVLDTTFRTWTKIRYPPDAKVPIPRRAHTTWLYKGKMYMFGGGNGEKALNDIWTLDVMVPYEEMRWEEVQVRGKKPGARGYHTANLVRDVVVVIGGSDGSYVFDDVWALQLSTMTWQQIRLETNKKRLGHTSTQVGSYLFVIGGHDGTQYSRELQLFNLVTFQWEPRETKGRQPTGRGYHRAVLHDSRIFVFGGFDGQRVFEDVNVLDLAAAAYLPQVTSFYLMQEVDIIR